MAIFELSIIRKYLIPQKRQLSVALIGFLSVGVISLVVWLVLVFLSVTEGIEKSWLDKLTSLNAPLRINPTEAYYSSYYHLSDTISANSSYTPKSISEKAEAFVSDPYDPTVDAEPPSYWSKPDLAADGTLKDPVKLLMPILKEMEAEVPGFAFQEYEIAGAMLRLNLIRPSSPFLTLKGQESQTTLTQVSYLSTFAPKNPYLTALVLPPSAEDLNHLFFLTNYPNNAKPFSEKITTLFQKIKPHKIKTSIPNWKIPFSLLPENIPFAAIASLKKGEISHLFLPLQEEKFVRSTNFKPGLLCKKGNYLHFEGERLSSHTPVFLEDTLEMEGKVVSDSLKTANQFSDILFHIATKIQNHPLEGAIPWDGVEIAEASVGPNILEESSEKDIFLAKNLKENGARIGDRGFLSYQASTAGSVQEQRIPIRIKGFYDPGILAVGSKAILAPSDVVHTIHLSSAAQMIEKTSAEGIQVWFKKIESAPHVAALLKEKLSQAGIETYWKISTFHEYDFAKDLLQQFQSDRYLFTLIAMIILAVACSNIISMLLLLVSNKKKEIAILQAMGASRLSIALIFGGCGMCIGILSSLIGIGAGALTLTYLDQLVQFLSYIQGRDAFNTAFYDAFLPNQMSLSTLKVILIGTPVISLIAGLIPAIQACRLRPSAILRSE